MREIPERAVNFVAAKETCAVEAYVDIGGVWTIGFGHTGGVKQGDICNGEQARNWLADDLITARSKLVKYVSLPVLTALNDNQFSALLSFAFNVGAKSGWGIWRVLNNRQFDQVPAQLMRFVFDGGKPSPGLVNRRKAEVALWNEVDASGTATPIAGGVGPAEQKGTSE